MSDTEEKNNPKNVSRLKKVLFVIFAAILIVPIIKNVIFDSPLQVSRYLGYMNAAMGSADFREFVIYKFIGDGYEALALARFYREAGGKQRAAEISRYGQYLMKNGLYQDDEVLRELESIR